MSLPRVAGRRGQSTTPHLKNHMRLPDITQGPWKHWPTHWAGGSASVQVNGKNVPWVENDCDGIICHINCDRMSCEEGVKMAKAIAAVPDMLAVLEQILPDWHKDADDTSIHNGLVAGEISYGDMRAIRAVLIKAGATDT